MSSAAGRRRPPKRPASASTVVRDVVERERRLRDDRDRLALRVERERVLGRLDHDRRLGPLAERPDHLDVVGVADERDQVAAVGVAPRLRVHLRDERADGVDDAQPALLAVLLHRRRDPVRREHADLAGRDLVLALDEDGAEPLEPAHDVLVVDDVVADVDRRPVLLEQPLDDLDRAVDAGAERPRRREQDPPAHATASTPCSARRAPRARPVPSRPARARTRASEADPVRRAVGLRAARRCRPAAAPGVSRDRRGCSPRAARCARARRTPCRRRRRRSLAQPRPLRGVVDDPRRAEDRPRDARRRRRAARPPRAPRRARRRRASRRSRSRPAGPSRSAPAMPNETSRPRARRCDAPRPISAVGPARRAARSSAVVAQAKVSRPASKPCSGRSPSCCRPPRTRPTARSRSGSRSARSADRCPGRSPPTRSRRAAPRRSGRCRR